MATKENTYGQYQEEKTENSSTHNVSGWLGRLNPHKGYIEGMGDRRRHCQLSDEIC